LIVGFPGETEADFAELSQFVADTRFERLGVFTYSQEEGTVAGEWDDTVPEEEKQRRQAEIMEIQSEISYEHNRRIKGEQFTVIVDALDEAGTAVGRTVWDSPEIDNTVVLDRALAPGSFAHVTCTEADVYDLKARVDKIVE
jgi:ribosomal protein S12 methylthiotransferase